MAQNYQGEQIPCNLCGSEESTTVATKSKDGSRLMTALCSDCGLVFTNPMPTKEEMDAFYRWAYRSEYKGVSQPKLKHIYRAGSRAIPRYQRLAGLGKSQPEKILDMGSGGGEFLYLMKSVGSEAWGVEPNQGYGQFSIDEYGIKAKLNPLEDIDFEPASFDIITANHVLEHIRDPLVVLKRLRQWLKPDGLMIIEVPNVEATYHAPHTKFHFAHVYNFSAQTLSRLGARAGLKTVDTAFIPHTQHINIAFALADKESTEAEVKDNRHAQSVRDLLAKHTKASHMFSHQPYTRLWSNLMRPLKEKRALSQYTFVE